MCAFDSVKGDLYVGDVGQNDIEEVNLVVKGGNHGWNLKEGALFFHINGYVLSRDRVHLLDVPFAEALKVVSRWGSGSKSLVAAMNAKNARARADRV